MCLVTIETQDNTENFIYVTVSNESFTVKVHEDILSLILCIPEETSLGQITVTGHDTKSSWHLLTEEFMQSNIDLN